MLTIVRATAVDHVRPRRDENATRASAHAVQVCNLATVPATTASTAVASISKSAAAIATGPTATTSYVTPTRSPRLHWVAWNGGLLPQTHSARKQRHLRRWWRGQHVERVRHRNGLRGLPLPLQHIALATRAAVAAVAAASAAALAASAAALLSPDLRKLLHDRERRLRQRHHHILGRVQCSRHGARHRRPDRHPHHSGLETSGLHILPFIWWKWPLVKAVPVRELYEHSTLPLQRRPRPPVGRAPITGVELVLLYWHRL